jgi:hypothetical protein
VACFHVDSHQRFVLDCATVERGASVDTFEAYMLKRGWTKREYENLPHPDKTAVVVFTPGGGDEFFVYFNPETGAISNWRFDHD